MKLKQRVVLLAAGLLLLAVAKILLLDGSEGTETSRRDLQAFRKVTHTRTHTHTHAHTHTHTHTRVGRGV